LLATQGDDPVLCALQETLAGLSAAAASAAAGSPPRAVSVEALRVALSATDAVRFNLVNPRSPRDLATVCETWPVQAFEAPLDR